MDLGLDVTEEAGVAVLTVRGEVDVATAPRLRQQIVEMAGEGHTRLVVDLNPVEFLDSTGLGVLVGGLKRLRGLGGDLVLACSQRRILRVLEITGLDKAFALYPDAKDAASAVGID